MTIEFAYQRLSANPQAVALLQGFSLLSVSNARNMRNMKPPAMRGGGGDIAKVKNNTRTQISVAADTRSQDFSKPFTGNLRFLSHLVGG